MTPDQLRRWREQHFPRPTERASLDAAITWFGVKSRRAWTHWEDGTRPIPQPLVNRIEAEKVCRKQMIQR